MKVINEIGGQEQGRASAGCQHAGAVRRLIAVFNEAIAGEQQEGAERIQRRVHSRQGCYFDQAGPISGSSMRIKNRQRINGTIAIIARVFRSNLRCMKYIATRAAFQTASITSRAPSKNLGRPRKVSAT